MQSDPRRPRRAPLAHALLPLCAIALLAVASPGALGAQQSDSARVGATARPPGDTLLAFGRARVRPRTAVLRSLALPGWGQASLDRPTAAALFIIVEAGSAAMIVKSKRSLDRAKDARDDSIFVRWKVDDSGNPVVTVDPITGDTVPVPEYARDPLVDRIPSRRGQLESWIAVLVANHFFSMADAFVAAQLSDIPRRVQIRRTPDAWVLAARVTW